MIPIKEQSPAVQFLLAASLILTVVNLTFVVCDRFRDFDYCDSCKRKKKSILLQELLQVQFYCI